MIALIGLVVGIIIGIVVNPTLPPGLQPYLPIMIVAALTPSLVRCVPI